MKPLSKTETILVPHDFTQVADFALFHANQISKLTRKSVTLTHIVKTDADKKDAERRLEKIAEDNKSKFGIETKTIVNVGNYLKKIGEIGEIVKAAIVVMGTHGVRGVQKLIGSYALKVITQSDVPYIVVQDEPGAEKKFENIVVPLDFTKESKQKIYALLTVAETFKSKVHIIADYESDEFTAKSLKNNIVHAEALLKENGINYEIHQLDSKNNGLIKETMSYCFKVRADLIVVMTSVDSSLSKLVMGASETALITNDALIPVMCMNPVGSSILASGMTIAHGG